MTESILAGTRVLDLSAWLPGPYCTTILGDLGAEVIKVERRLMGDPARLAPPTTNHQSCYFLALNRNKKSIALNLKRDQGRKVFMKLAASADVLLESFKPGYVNKIGVGYEAVRAVNPDVVYCSLSGYGQDGPYAQRAGHDINYSALGGLLSLMPPRGRPTLPGIQIADVSGALFASIGILSALVQRDRTGQGTYIDVSMLDSLVGLLSPSMAALLCDLPAPEAYENLAGQLPCYNLYRTSDGRYMALGAIEPAFWADFCRAIGREDLIGRQFPASDEREDVIAELQKVFTRRTQADWIEFFAEREVCCEPVQSLEEALAHPQVQHRGMVFYLDHPTAGRIGQVDLPIRFSGEDASAGTEHQQPRNVTPAPLLGQHTVDIMRQLGYSDAEIEELRERKVIGTPDDAPSPATVARRTRSAQRGAVHQTGDPE